MSEPKDRALPSAQEPRETGYDDPRALVQHVAQLASLTLSEVEGERLAREMSSILAYVGELSALDTSNVPPTAQVGVSRRVALRSDEVEPCLSHEEALSQAPRTSQGGFAVPAFVESES
jgi:aspartyl-tRNA(Asn)/glutamyl-tRNA(Gln) amidotransferase subunit C